MITIQFGCTFLGNKCDESTSSRFEITLSPETMLLASMGMAKDNGWLFTGADPARALCPAHAHTQQVPLIRVFARLNRIAGVHGLVMVGVEECPDGRSRVALGASTDPDPANLVRLHRADVHQVVGMIQDAAHYTVPAERV